jgi:hypothetical protein
MSERAFLTTKLAMDVRIKLARAGLNWLDRATRTRGFKYFLIVSGNSVKCPLGVRWSGGLTAPAEATDRSVGKRVGGGSCVHEIPRGAREVP